MEARGEEVTLVTVAVQVSVTIFSSDLILIPPVSILTLGCAGGRLGLAGPFTRSLRSVLPGFQAWIGTWTLFLSLPNLSS